MARGFLFFDLDGTVAESGRDIHNAMNEVMSEMGAAEIAETELHQLIGPPLQHGLPPILEARGIDVQHVQEVIDRYRLTYKSKYLPYTKPITGIPEVIRQLHDENWVMAVVTSKPQPQAGIAVRATGLMDAFVAVVGPQENDPIPKTQLLRSAVTEIEVRVGVDVDMSRSWMIGDRHFDIAAAHGVGMASIGVLWGYGDTAEFESAGAHQIATHPHELLTIVA